MSDLRTTLPNLHEALSELLWDTEDRPPARQPPARRSTPALCVVRWRLLLKSARCQGRKRCALRLPKALLASALVMLRRACGCRRVERRGPWHWPRRCYSPLGRSWCRLPGFRPTSRLRRHPRHRRLTHWPFPTQLPQKHAPTSRMVHGIPPLVANPRFCAGGIDPEYVSRCLSDGLPWASHTTGGMWSPRRMMSTAHGGSHSARANRHPHFAALTTQRAQPFPGTLLSLDRSSPLLRSSGVLPHGPSCVRTRCAIGNGCQHGSDAR